MQDNRQRVNKITAAYSGDGIVTITLYKTHQRLGTFTNDDMGIPDIADTKLSRNVYLDYCKDAARTFLENGAVPGYYWDNPTDGDGQANPSRKYDKSIFISVARDTVSDILTGLNIEYDIRDTDQISDVLVAESYKDGYIKYGTANITVTLDKLSIIIPVYIKSGQLCKPKVFTYNGREMGLNNTNLNKVVSGHVKM